jgi:hypothetical protein
MTQEFVCKCGEHMWADPNSFHRVVCVKCNHKGPYKVVIQIHDPREIRKPSRAGRK